MNTPIKLHKLEIEVLKDLLTRAIQELYDDPHGYSNKKEDIVEYNIILISLCDKLGLDFSKILKKECSKYEIERMRIILGYKNENKNGQ